MDDNKMIVWIVALVAAVVCCLIISVAFCSIAEKKAAFENGYEQTTLSGSNSVYWVKTEKK